MLRTLDPAREGAVAGTLETNDLYAAAMCRLHYRRVPAPLPQLGDPDAVAAYWKQHYNTALGAGTPEQFKSSFIALAVRDAWATST